MSGSLAHIYFTGHDRPLHLEEICALYPGLVESLARHPGIGFVAWPAASSATRWPSATTASAT